MKLSESAIGSYTSETFAGDLDGESQVRALQVLRDDKSACLECNSGLHSEGGFAIHAASAGRAKK
jgi:hypothetical protein